jgi:hypothetical protein
MTVETENGQACDQAATTRPGCAFRRSRLTLPLRMLAGLFAFAMIGLGGFCLFVSWQLSKGPVSFDIVTREIVAVIEQRLGDNFTVEVRDAALRRNAEGLNLTIDGITVRDATGQSVIAAPRAVVAFDGSSLLQLTVAPREIYFVGLSVALTIFPDGNVSVSAMPPEAQATENPTERAEPKPDEARTADGDAPLPELSPLRLSSFVDAIVAPTGPLAILERVGLRDGSLRIDDQRNHRVVTYRDAALMFSRNAAAERNLMVRASGPHGRWGVSATVAGHPGEDRRVAFSVTDLAVSELLGFAEKGTIPVSTDMPVSFDLGLTLAPDGSVKTLAGRITGGSAVVTIDDPDVKPISVSSLRGQFALEPDGRTLRMAMLDLRGGAMHWRLSGDILVPQTPTEGWRFAFRGDDSVLALQDLKLKSIIIDSLTLNGVVHPGFVGVDIDKLEVRGPEVTIDMAASLGRTPSWSGLGLHVEAAHMPAKSVLAFWPTFVVPDIRNYFVDAMDGGTVERFDYRLRVNPEELAAVIAKKPMPDEALRLTLAVSDGAMRPAPGFPAVTDISADAVITGRTARVNFAKATAKLPGGRALGLAKGSYKVDDTARHPAIAELAFKMKGSAEAFATALKSEGMRDFSGPSFDPAAVHGQFEGRTTIRFPLVPKPEPGDVGVEASGQFGNLSIEKVYGKEKLEGGNLAFTFDQTGLGIKGDGKIGGIPALIDMRQKPGVNDPDLNLVLTLDDVARGRRGLKSANQMAGPVSIRLVSGPASGLRPGSALVDIDFTRASINGVLPGWVKPAGKASKASLKLNTVGEDQFEFRDFVLDGGTGLALKGEGEFTGDGTLTAGRFVSVKFAPGDDMKLDIERQGAGYKVTARANALDARAFLKSATGPSSGDNAAADLDLDMKAASLTGFSGETMSNVELRLVNRGTETREFRLVGRLSRASVSGQMSRTGNGTPAILIESADAGGFFRFTDLYRRMVGGAMLLQVSGIGDPVDGLLVVNGFSLQNDPALSGVSKVPENKTGRIIVDDASNVPFSKLRAQFALSNGVLMISDATMWGPAVGGTLDGKMDFARDKADLTGTFVPAYGLNNVLTRVPLLGTLLGGPNEGVFAVNFRVNGPVSNPAVTYNPLSVVAPGILRKLFGVVRTEAESDQTGATEPRRKAVPPSKQVPQPTTPTNAAR